jgi:hypothetical protein
MPKDLADLLEGLNKPDSEGRVYGILVNAGTVNSWRKVYPNNESDFKLSELYDFVGDPIEMVYIDDDHFMIINEEGKLSGLPLNMTATIISGLLPHDVIVGNALICGKDLVL